MNKVEGLKGKVLNVLNSLNIQKYGIEEDNYFRKRKNEYISTFLTDSKLR